jgi:hypothetical protein
MSHTAIICRSDSADVLPNTPGKQKWKMLSVESGLIRFVSPISRLSPTGLSEITGASSEFSGSLYFANFCTPFFHAICHPICCRRENIQYAVIA